jgi:hypothetical protein
MVKVFTKEALRKANNVAIKTDRNRTLSKKVFKGRSNDTLFPVTMAFVHNDVEMRVSVVLDEQGRSGMVDIPFSTFDALPIVVTQTEKEQLGWSIGEGV